MRICCGRAKESHTPICHNELRCPLCSALDYLERVETEKEDLERRMEHIESEVHGAEVTC